MESVLIVKYKYKYKVVVLAGKMTSHSRRNVKQKAEITFSEIKFVQYRARPSNYKIITSYNPRLMRLR